MATKKQVEAEVVKPKAAHPKSVTLASTYSFFDESGAHLYWQEGQDEADAERIAMLIERQAPLKESHE